MDYTEELKKIRKELLEAPNTNEKAFAYKVLAYKKALDDFKYKEEQSFMAELLGDSILKYGIKEDDESLKVEPRLLRRALGINWSNLSNTEKLRLTRTERKHSKSIDELIQIYKDMLQKNGGVTHSTMRFGKLLNKDICTLEVESVGNRKTYITKL